MPKRTDIQSIMIIGAGPIIIGQACEFDYSGAQACKALREEGYRVILVNSNPATIMTDPGLADATYIEPITPEVVAKIIEKERPDALLPTLLRHGITGWIALAAIILALNEFVLLWVSNLPFALQIGQLLGTFAVVLAVVMFLKPMAIAKESP